MAIGAAKVMGIKLMNNFNRPYFSRSMSEFWKRWHISLSSWFRDYVYITLGGNRVSIPRWYLNLFIVFLISGLWHGANWTYVIWGALNGFYLIFAIISQGFRNKAKRLVGLDKLPWLNNLLEVMITFALSSFAWIFFRANHVTDAFGIIKKIATSRGSLFIESPSMMIYSFLGLFILFLVEFKKEYYKGKFSFFNNEKWIIRALSCCFLIITILLFGVFDGGQFIYFQF